MTNLFFEKIWCNDIERDKLLGQTKPYDRLYFNNMNTTGENLRIKFIKVNESQKTKVFELG
jgi:hypothetical protein